MGKKKGKAKGDKSKGSGALAVNVGIYLPVVNANVLDIRLVCSTGHDWRLARLSVA